MKNATLLKKNDKLTVTVEDITNLGFGVAKHEGAVIFIADTVMDDVCEIQIIKAAASYYVGKLVRMIKPSEKRVASRCDSGRCRSCAYKCIDYSEELKIKENFIRSAFIKEGLSDVSVLPTVPSPRVRGYRN